MRIQWEPLTTWPGEPSKVRINSDFTAGLIDTLVLLERELEFLKAKSPVVAIMGMRDTDLRNDGQLRANARVGPGVSLHLDSRHGNLRYSTDKFRTWQDNLRAISLGLEALRRVDRYGIGKGGEQYRGWKQIAPPTPAPDPEVAAVFLAELAGDPLAWSDVVKDRDIYRRLKRKAMRAAHPDTGGDAATFNHLTTAIKILDLKHRL